MSSINPGTQTLNPMSMDWSGGEIIEDSGSIIGAHRLVFWYLVFIPVLWLLGLQFVFGVAIIFWLLIQNRSYLHLFDGVVLAWLMVGLAQATSVLINWSESGADIGNLIHRLLSTTVTGWIFLGILIALGRSYRFASDRIVRGVCVIGLYFLIFGTIAIILSSLMNTGGFSFTTPLGMLFPQDMPFTKNALNIQFFKTDEIFGFAFPRLSLFSPWPVIMGFIGISVFFISLNEKNLIWKIIGTCGGMFALVTSWSRAVMVAFLVSGLLYGWLKLNSGLRGFLFTLATLIAIPLLIYNFSLFQQLDSLYDYLMSLRAGSSSARELGMQMSWEGFLASPIFGHGWPGAYIHENIPMPVGSHSTVFGVLYTGGIVTIFFLMVALFYTLGKLYMLAGRHGRIEKSALMAFFILTLLCYGEGIYTFVLPSLFVFCWIGGALAAHQSVKNTEPKIFLR